MLVTEEELHCRNEYLPLPDDLNANGLTSQIDWSEAFFLPTFAYTSHEVSFTAREGQSALRVFLAKSNCKASILNKEDRKLVAQSRPIDQGSAQLMIATDLTAGNKYIIVLEFSERHGAIEGQAARSCDNFVLAVKTADSNEIASGSWNMGDS